MPNPLYLETGSADLASRCHCLDCCVGCCSAAVETACEGDGGENEEEEDRGFFFLLSGGKSAQREYIAQIKGVDGELAQAGAEPAQRAEVSAALLACGRLWSSVWLLLLASA